MTHFGQRLEVSRTLFDGEHLDRSAGEPPDHRTDGQDPQERAYRRADAPVQATGCECPAIGEHRTVRDYVEIRSYARAPTPAPWSSTELEGGALSVTNLGMFGTEDFAAIINPPQSAILAVGAARQEPVVVDSQVEVGKILRVTLSVDHRAIDGRLAADGCEPYSRSSKTHYES